MPLKIKDTGAWKQLKRGDVPLNSGGTVVDVQQIWLKNAGVWQAMFEIFAQARWGYAAYAGPGLNENGYLGPQSFIDGNLNTMMPSNEDGETLTYLLVDDTTYAYFAYPKSLGTAVFTDTGNGFAGAWDGAGVLSDGSNFGSASGPVEVTYDAGNGPEQWYVYRTDWPGPNSESQTFRVDYPNRPANA